MAAPDFRPMLDIASRMLIAGDLEEIARSDYGNDFDEHLDAMRDIVRDQDVPAHLEWCPREVLELTRYGGIETASHQRQVLFSSAVLLTAYGKGFEGLAAISTLPALIESMEALGDRWPREALGLIAWALAGLDRDVEGDRPLYLLAILRFALDERSDWSNDAVLALVDHIIGWEDAELSESMASYGYANTAGWVLRRMSFDSRHEFWRSFGKSLRSVLSPRHGDEIAEGVMLIDLMLESEPAKRR